MTSARSTVTAVSRPKIPSSRRTRAAPSKRDAERAIDEIADEYGIPHEEMNHLLRDIGELIRSGTGFKPWSKT